MDKYEAACADNDRQLQEEAAKAAEEEALGDEEAEEEMTGEGSSSGAAASGSSSSLNPRASSGADIDLLTVSADHLRRVALGGKLVQQPLDEQTKLMPTSIPGTDSNPSR